jgi:hypothetical protein
MIVYKVIKDVIKGWREKPDTYILRTNEIEGDKFQKPVYNPDTGQIEEGWTSDDDIIQLQNAKRNKVFELKMYAMQNVQSYSFDVMANVVNNTQIKGEKKTFLQNFINITQYAIDEVNALTDINEVYNYQMPSF